jgi:uncharacterized iron-regulated membrane protein
MEVARRHPQAQLVTLSLPEKDNATIQATARHDIHIHYNAVRYQFDQFTGKLLNVVTFEEKQAGEKLRAMNYDIHVGSILGPTGKLIAFVASLISASLPITGFLMWYGRRNKKAATQKIIPIRPARTKQIVRPTFAKQSAKSG